MNKWLPALFVVLLASGARAQGPEVLTFMSKAGFYAVAPDITLNLEMAAGGDVEFELKKTTNLPDDGIHTLTIHAKYGAGGEKFFFYWDGAASTLWIASPDGVIFHVLKEDFKPGDPMTGMPSDAMFAGSPRPFREEVRKRFPDNFFAKKADPAISR